MKSNTFLYIQEFLERYAKESQRPECVLVKICIRKTWLILEIFSLAQQNILVINS